MMRIELFGMTAATASLAVLMTACATRQPANNSLAPLPEAVTSFGAVTDNGWLYAFGGHKGARHDYTAEKVSGAFHRLRLDDGRAWETLPPAAPGQGQPLVAVGGRVYRIGGMAARNRAGEKQDLESTALVQQFDPRLMRWADATPLPEPRSSHDAAVAGGKIYVAGGWRLDGGTSKAVWPDKALEFDPSHPEAGWHEFPQPFRRRALALAAAGSRVFCIGGMDSDNQPTLAVDVYHTTSGSWSKGPDLPDGKNKGFACSAAAQDGRVYVTTFQGDLLRLSHDFSAWEVVGRLDHPRMAHRLVAAGSRHLIALGGEDGEIKRPDLEWILPASKPVAALMTGPIVSQGSTGVQQ